MSKLIEGKAGRMELSTIALFNHMTDEDFMAVHKAGQLENFCHYFNQFIIIFIAINTFVIIA